MARKKTFEQFAVIGLGRFGAALTKELYKNGKEVLAIDISEDKVNSISNDCTHAVVADASDPNILKELGIANFDSIIVSIGDNMQASVLATMICKELGAKNVIAKAQNHIHKIVLEKIGADNVFVPEDEMAIKIASTLITPGLDDIMEITKEYSIVEIGIPMGWEGKTILELDIRSIYKINLLVISREEGVITPTASTILKENDKLIIGGMNADIQKFTINVSSNK